MPDAWIQLQCPNCGETWEANPSALPAPDAAFTCDHCGTERRTSEFPQSTRDFEILEEFHAT
jgi:hypothetical protein